MICSIRSLATAVVASSSIAGACAAGFDSSIEAYDLVVNLNVEFVGPVVLDLDLANQGFQYEATGTSSATAFGSTGAFDGILIYSFFQAGGVALTGTSNFPFGPGVTMSFDTNLSLLLTSESGGTAVGTFYGFDPFAQQWVTAQASGTFSLTAVPAPGALALLGLGGLVGSRRRR